MTTEDPCTPPRTYLARQADTHAFNEGQEPQSYACIEVLPRCRGPNCSSFSLEPLGFQDDMASCFLHRTVVHSLQAVSLMVLANVS